MVIDAMYFLDPPKMYLREIPRQVAGTPRPPSPLLERKVHAVSAFLSGQLFCTLRLAPYSSLVRRATRPVPGIILGAHYSAGLRVPIVLPVTNVVI